MSDLLTFGVLGFRHIADLNAADHVLFLLALAAGFRLREWKRAAWIISAFTIGHSITLGLAAGGWLILPTAVIEFLIPVTIVLACLENLRGVRRGRQGIALTGWFALGFGLVHGAGFANYLRAMLVEPIALPLLGFNLGVEAGQLVILLAAGVLLGLADHLLARFPLRRLEPYAARVVIVSAAAGILAGRMALERSTW